MPMIANVYRRGSIYWFRSNLRLFNNPFRWYKASLDTACGKQARPMAAALRAASWFEECWNRRSRVGWISDSALTAIGRQAYGKVLRHLRSKYTFRHDPALLREVNEAMCDMFAILETAGGVVEHTAISQAAFCTRVASRTSASRSSTLKTAGPQWPKRP